MGKCYAVRVNKVIRVMAIGIYLERSVKMNTLKFDVTKSNIDLLYTSIYIISIYIILVVRIVDN